MKSWVNVGEYSEVCLNIYW